MYVLYVMYLYGVLRYLSLIAILTTTRDQTNNNDNKNLWKALIKKRSSATGIGTWSILPHHVFSLISGSCETLLNLT